MKQRFELPIYHGYIDVYILNEISEVNELFELEPKIECEKFEEMCLFKTENHIRRTILVFRNKELELQDINHELLHATNHVLQHAGIYADHNNDEAQAYLMGYLTKIVVGYLSKKVKIIL